MSVKFLRTILFALVSGLMVALLLIRTEDTEPRFIEPELRAYLNSFLSRAEQVGVKIEGVSTHRIEFVSEMQDTNIGLCYPYLNRLYINKSFWVTASKSQREELMYHELAHCLLDLPHSNNYPDIMQPKGLLGDAYLVYYNIVLHKMYNKDPNKTGVTFVWENIYP